jgi:integrase/recombinase XerD
MTAAAPSTALATIQPAFTDAERLALAGYLAGYRGLTREAYALDLRQFTTWCRTRSVALFAVRRAGIESFARDLEAKGRARATVTRRLSTIAGFYKYAVEEELLDHSPAAHVRRPRADYESHAIALDRNELGALLVAAGLGPPAEHALVSPLALNGLRVSEATGADIEQLGLERGHRTLTITRKGGKVVTIPLAPRTARAIDLAVGERTDGPVFLATDGRRLDRHGAGRVVRKVAHRAGIGKAVTPHTLRHAFITAALDAGVPLRDVQEAASHADPRTTMRYDRGRPGQRAGSAADVLPVQLGFEQVHGLEEGFLLAGGELVQDAGQRCGGAIEPVADQGCLAGDDLDDRAPPVGRVRAPLDQACAVKVGEHAADRGESQVQPGGQFPDGERAAADLLERGDVPRAQRRGHGRGRGALLPAPHSPGHAGKQLH